MTPFGQIADRDREEDVLVDVRGEADELQVEGGAASGGATRIARVVIDFEIVEIADLRRAGAEDEHQYKERASHGCLS
jgi:hypothetical protein